jgi:phenylpropionate dioxygenase-like ring-hydroxylating dioxygenase large terminal subunit
VTEERRRETKAGFATQKECEAAMNKLLVKVEEQVYTPPTKASVREYLTKEWLPAVKATIRPTTYRSYEQHVMCHIAPHIGSVKLAKLTGSQVNHLYAKLAETVAFSDQVQLEDIAICEAVQKGLRSRSYDRGRYSVKRENGVHHFHRLIEAALAEEGGQSF